MDGGEIDEEFFTKREFKYSNQQFIKGLKNHFKPYESRDKGDGEQHTNQDGVY